MFITDEARAASNLDSISTNEWTTQKIKIEITNLTFSNSCQYSSCNNWEQWGEAEHHVSAVARSKWVLMTIRWGETLENNSLHCLLSWCSYFPLQRDQRGAASCCMWMFVSLNEERVYSSGCTSRDWHGSATIPMTGISKHAPSVRLSGATWAIGRCRKSCGTNEMHREVKGISGSSATRFHVGLTNYRNDSWLKAEFMWEGDMIILKHVRVPQKKQSYFCRNCLKLNEIILSSHKKWPYLNGFAVIYLSLSQILTWIDIDRLDIKSNSLLI